MKFPVERRRNSQQAAEYLGRKKATLDEWRSKGTGPKFYRAGHFVFYLTDDLDDWILAQSERAA